MEPVRLRRTAAKGLRLNARTPPAATAAQAGVSSPSWHQFLTIAGTLAVVDSVLIGGALGLAVQAGTGTLAPAGYLPRQASDLARAAASVSTTASQ